MSEPQVQVTYSLENIETAAARLWEYLRSYRVLAFSGQLGAGKTTFIHALCNVLRVQDSVSSPTFSLINEYHFINKEGKDQVIYHMDWYRLKNTDEAINAGMEDALQQPNAYCFIEWPEQAAELLTSPYLFINIKAQTGMERTVEVWLR